MGSNKNLKLIFAWNFEFSFSIFEFNPKTYQILESGKYPEDLCWRSATKIKDSFAFGFTGPGFWTASAPKLIYTFDLNT
jgi:hypothetical protein